MSDVILFPNPTPEDPESGDPVWHLVPLECGLTTREIARKDVPAGQPFLIVDSSEMPDPKYRSALRVDFSNPDGHGIGPEAWFAEQESKKAGGLE